MKAAAETVPRNKRRRSNLATRIPNHNDVFPFAEGEQYIKGLHYLTCFESKCFPCTLSNYLVHNKHRYYNYRYQN